MNFTQLKCGRFHCPLLKGGCTFILHFYPNGDTPHSVFPARWEGDINRIKFWPTRKDTTVQQRLSSCEQNCAYFLWLHSSCKGLQHGLTPSGSYSSFNSTAYSPQRSPAPADIVWPTQLHSNTSQCAKDPVSTHLTQLTPFGTTEVQDSPASSVETTVPCALLH